MKNRIVKRNNPYNYPVIIGEYLIVGNRNDGYAVWRTNDGEDSDTLYDNISFENCVAWCLNS
jgi:hypothetical protein